MLNEEEQKELKKLSPELELKVKEWSKLFDKVRKSHWLSVYLTMHKQMKALQAEIEEEAFTVRPKQMDLGIDEDGIVNIDDVKKAIADADDNRKQVETTIKTTKAMMDWAQDMEDIYTKKLTIDEKEIADKVTQAGEAEEIQQSVLKKLQGG